MNLTQENTSEAAAGSPLAGLLVVDLSQFLAGPYASLRLQDLGARVIKIEREGQGDLTRQLYLSDTVIDGDSTIFHAINRGKQSLALNLKTPTDVARLKHLVRQADVVIQNFRPGVIERLGLSYDTLKAIKPDLVYASVSGYGPDGPWHQLPGQDLLAQARSGVMWLNGSADDGPVPFGLAIADMFAGATIAQGILAALVQRGISGRGAHVETSLLECMLDMQFEVLATHLNDGQRPPRRSAFRSAHVGLAAPYGVYPTSNGFLAIAMTPIDQLADLLDCDALGQWSEKPQAWFSHRDDIKKAVSSIIVKQDTEHWLALLEPHDIWCSPVMSWQELLEHEAFHHLDMVQTLSKANGFPLQLMRSPLRLDGHRSKSTRAAPSVGEHNETLIEEFGL